MYKYTNDARNLLAEEIDPMGYSVTYTYDGNGNVLKKTDKNGTVIISKYNGINNVLATSANSYDEDGECIGISTYSYEYMQGGSLLKSVANSVGTITYGYNSKGQLTSETSTADNTTKSYTYDKEGNKTNLTITKDGSPIINQNNIFGSLNRLSQVYDVINNKTVASYTYDNAGNVTSKETADGMQKTVYSYNESNLLTKVENMSIGDRESGKMGTYSSYEYEYYLDGNRAKETDNVGRSKEYTYDKAGRLQSEMYSNKSGLDSWANKYTYDAKGNRISKFTKKGTYEEVETSLSEIQPYRMNIEESKYKPYIPKAPLPDLTDLADYSVCSYTYDKNNRLTESSWYDNGYMNRIVSYGYDENGNMTYKKTKQYYDDFAPEDATIIDYPDDTSYYSYNELNQLTRVNRNGNAVAYSYDPAGQRIAKTVDGVTTKHIWDDSGNIVAENNTIFIRGISGEILSTKDFDEQYYSYNGHGDTTNLTQQSGTTLAVTATYEYDAFGNCSATGTAGNDNPFRYNGQYYDEETGLIYLRNRYYDPSIGRFIQEDEYWNTSNMIYGDKQYDEGEIKIPDNSAIAQSTNLYVYCMNDPVNGIDPWGLYNRWAAVEYAMYWSVNSTYFKGNVRFSQDCTNFVSWCLNAGGICGSDDWYYNYSVGRGKYVYGSFSATWTNSEEQFKAFTNCTGEFPNLNIGNGNAICIHDPRWISDVIRGYNIQPGDLLYFLDPTTNKMGHTAIIVSTDNGHIIYAQHDDDKNNGDLNKYLAEKMYKSNEFTYVYVVRIRDDA